MRLIIKFLIGSFTLLTLSCKVYKKELDSFSETKKMQIVNRLNSAKFDSLTTYINSQDNYEELKITSKIEDTIIFNICDFYSYNEKTFYNVFISEETEKIKVVFRCNIPNLFVTSLNSFEAKTGGKIIPSSNFFIKENQAYIDAVMNVNCSSIVTDLSSFRLANISLSINGDNPLTKTFYVLFYY